MCRKTRDFRKEFLESGIPLTILVEAPREKEELNPLLKSLHIARTRKEAVG